MLAFFFLLSLVLVLFLKHSSFGTSQLPPGPKVWQVVQNISKFGKKPHVAFRNLAKVYGPLFSLQLGSRVVIIVSSPATAEQILKTHDRVFSGRSMPSVHYKIPQIGRSSLSTAIECNESWKTLRGLTQNFILSSRAVDSKGEIRKAKVLEMLEYLKRKESEVVMLDDIAHVTVCNIAANILVSRNLLDIKGEDEKSRKVNAIIKEIVETGASLGLADLFPILKNVDFYTRKRAMNIYWKIIHVWKDVIEERVSRSNDKNTDLGSTHQDFLDVLMNHAFLNDQISIILMETLLAGTDSTFVTVVWLMVQLIKNEEILCRVRNEIVQAIEGDAINESILSKLEYFQACIKETLRLHPPGPFLLPHRAIKKYQIDNYTIPKDSTVLVNAWAIHLDPNNWKDPTSFNPDRFLDSKIDFRKTHFEFIPFGAGQRMCPGITMGLRNIQLMVASLIHYFDWSLPDGMDPINLDTNEKFGTILKREKPFHLIPRIREKHVVELHESKLS